MLTIMLVCLVSPAMADKGDCFGSAMNDIEAALAEYERQHGAYYKDQRDEYEALQRQAPNPQVTYQSSSNRTSLTTYE